MSADVKQSDIPVGARVRFDNKRNSWLVRAQSDDGRYTLLTAWYGIAGVAYTVIDHHSGDRGPINVLGGGMGIDTLSGPDPQIDETMKMLRPYPPGYLDDYPEGRPVDPDDMYGYEVSRRRSVPTFINSVQVPANGPAS